MSLNHNLHTAITNGDESEVQILLKDGANVNAVLSRLTPFANAIESGHREIAMRLLSNEKFDPNVKNEMDRNSLFFASKAGEVEMMELLINMGGEPDCADIRGVTPLGATAWYDHHQATKMLIQKGARVNTSDIGGETPLYRACSNVSGQVAKTLLEYECNIDATTNLRHSYPMTTAIMASIPSKYEMEVRGRKMSEMIEIVKLLLRENCNLNIVDKNGQTALHHAVDNNEYHSACLFMEHGCDLNTRDNKGLSPLHLAILPDRPKYELALCLLHYGCDANQKLRDPETGEDVLPINLVLKSESTNPEIEHDRQKLLDTLIMATDFSNHALSSLKGGNSLQKDVNQSNNSNQMQWNWPFSFQHQCRLTIRRLLASHMLPKIDALPVGWCLKRFLALDCDYKKHHPLTTAELHTLVTDNDIKGLEHLVKSKTVDVNRSLRHKTPLTLAAHYGHVECSIFLLHCGAKASDADPCGQSAVHVAAANGKIPLLELLICQEMDINAENKQNNTPLLEAAINGQFEAAILLCLNGGNPSLVGMSEIPALHYAAGSGHAVATETFATRQDNLNMLDRTGNTALHIAASRGFLYLRNNVRLPALYKDKALEMLDAVKMMLSDSNPKYIHQEVVDHVTVIKCLLANGCDPRIRNQDSKNALDISRECGFHEVNRLLQDWINEHSE
ncbi:hypothetical protein SNE40_007027 [Patella caerulea]|uniref:SOCS box domain-containing protein n=1 Tax=Patella caerulea TaxID=87958 RepID=A0AAN8JYT1_PATCE